MTPKNLKLTTKELSKDTWLDLESLFRKPGIGDASWCWCTFHHTASFDRESIPRTRAERAVQNHKQKKELVEDQRAHGIIIYAEDEPVGWCQYGPRDELPRMDHARNYQKIEAAGDKERLWRITCFVIDKNYRKQGVASAALKAVIESIKANGGGLVEAFPVSKTDQGPGYMYGGRAQMFERLGFKKIAPLGTGRTQTVLMR